MTSWRASPGTAFRIRGQRVRRDPQHLDRPGEPVGDAAVWIPGAAGFGLIDIGKEPVAAHELAIHRQRRDGSLLDLHLPSAREQRVALRPRLGLSLGPRLDLLLTEEQVVAPPGPVHDAGRDGRINANDGAYEPAMHGTIDVLAQLEAPAELFLGRSALREAVVAQTGTQDDAVETLADLPHELAEQGVCLHARRIAGLDGAGVLIGFERQEAEYGDDQHEAEYDQDHHDGGLGPAGSGTKIVHGRARGPGRPSEDRTPCGPQILHMLRLTPYRTRKPVAKQ